jgi:HEAT repeat protein
MQKVFVFIPIKQQLAPTKTTDGKNISLFVIPVMVLQTPQGNKSIPNPHGQEVEAFPSLEAAIIAIEQAGFDAEFEGRHVRFNAEASLNAQQPKTPTKALTPKLQAEQLVQEGLKSAIPLLISRLKDVEAFTLVPSVRALGVLQAKEAIPAMLNLLGHDSPDVREAVSVALSQFGSGIVPDLMALYAKLLTESKGENAYRKRLDILNTYHELVKRNPTNILAGVMSQLLQALNDDQWLLRSAAAHVMATVAQKQREERQSPSPLAG